MIVRTVEASDAIALTALINEIIAIGGTTAHQTAFTPARFGEHYLTSPDAVCCHVVINAEGGALGFQVLGLHPELPAGWLDIGTYVRLDARGNGVGSALFAATLASAHWNNATAINATIRADNVLGLGYYRRMGFVDCASEPDFRLQDGQQVGRISKRYDL